LKRSIFFVQIILIIEIDSNQVDMVFVRDLDSMMSERERTAVKEFLKSDKVDPESNEKNLQTVIKTTFVHCVH
jgi:hypothetical protein